MSFSSFARDTSYCACETSFSAMIDLIQIWTSTRIGSARGDALKYALTYVREIVEMDRPAGGHEVLSR